MLFHDRTDAGVPGQPELAMGAVGEGDAAVLDRAVVRAPVGAPDAVAALLARASAAPA